MFEYVSDQKRREATEMAPLETGHERDNQQTKSSVRIHTVFELKPHPPHTFPRQLTRPGNL